MNGYNNESGLITVKFEFLDNEGNIELSELFYVVIEIDSENFDINRIQIIKECKFGSEEERYYYYMFDNIKHTFFTKNTDLTPYINTEKPIIMKNCKVYAEQIAEQLREETEKIKEIEKNDKLGKQSTTPENSENEELKMILSYLKNGLQNDLFCEMFIVSNGIQYLDDVIKYNEGNIREYALQIMSELLNFQSALDSCDQNKEILLNLYQILTSDENINNSILAIDIIILMIRTNEEKISYLIDIAEKYSKKTNALMFSQILKYLSSKYNETKLKTSVLMLINMVMTFSHPKKLLRVFIHLRDAGIFESINEARQLEDKTFEEQAKIFFEKAESAKTNPLYEIENYKIKIEDLKIKCDEIEKQYKSFEENEEIYDFIINYFQNLNIINQDDLDQSYFSNEIVNSDESFRLSNSQELTEEENKKDAFKDQELNISQTINSSDSKQSQSIPPPPPPVPSIQEIPPPPPLGFFSNVNA